MVRVSQLFLQLVVAWGPYWENIGQVLFLTKQKSKTNIFPVWTKQASSRKVVLLWLYFQFPESIVHLYRWSIPASKGKTLLNLLSHFHWSSAKFWVRHKQGNGFYLIPKCFLLNIFSRTQISEISLVLLSSPYTWQNSDCLGNQSESSLSPGPVQPYDKSMYSFSGKEQWHQRDSHTFLCRKLWRIRKCKNHLAVKNLHRSSDLHRSSEAWNECEHGGGMAKGFSQ